jgi:hypothetical protein
MNRFRRTMTCSSMEGYTDEQSAWLKAVARYQQRTGRHYPTCPEVLRLARELGYRLVAEPGPLPVFGGRRK